MFFALALVAGLAVFAYDYPDWGGGYEFYDYGAPTDYIESYSDSYISEAPYWYGYSDDDNILCPPPQLIVRIMNMAT